MLFTKKEEFTIRNDKAVSMVRLMGEFGLKFRVGDIFERYSGGTEWDQTKDNYRKFIIYGTKRKLRKFHYAVHILKLVNYELI